MEYRRGTRSGIDRKWDTHGMGSTFFSNNLQKLKMKYLYKHFCKNDNFNIE